VLRHTCHIRNPFPPYLHLVEGGNVGIHGGGGGDKGADSLWIPGLTTVEDNRSIKVRRDSREKSADFGKHRPLFVPP
jgi:hypothetical protein